VPSDLLPCGQGLSGTVSGQCWRRLAECDVGWRRWFARFKFVRYMNMDSFSER